MSSHIVIALDDGARGIVEMLFCTSLIALVGAADHPQSSPRKLQIVNTKVSSHPSHVYAMTPGKVESDGSWCM